MTEIPRLEEITQNRVAALVSNPVGYRLFGQWTFREGNRQNKSELLLANLVEHGYPSVDVTTSMNNLQAAPDATGIRLYQRSCEPPSLRRYGLPLQPAAGQAHETVHWVARTNPDNASYQRASA